MQISILLSPILISLMASYCSSDILTMVWSTEAWFGPSTSSASFYCLVLCHFLEPWSFWRHLCIYRAISLGFSLHLFPPNNFFPHRIQTSTIMSLRNELLRAIKNYFPNNSPTDTHVQKKWDDAKELHTGKTADYMACHSDFRDSDQQREGLACFFSAWRSWHAGQWLKGSYWMNTLPFPSYLVCFFPVGCKE